MEGKNGRNYALGRGELWFDQFKPGTLVGAGEKYFGNTPEFSTTSDSEELEHFDSDHGINEKDDSVTLSNTRSGAFTTDNITPANIALFFLGATNRMAQTAQTGKTETIVVTRGRAFQLGVSTALPAGIRGITNVVAKKGAAAVDIPGNFEFDLDLGRVYVELDATGVQDNDPIIFTYDVIAGTNTVIVSGAKEIEGAMRFVSFNPKGEPIDYFWPRVKLSPNGDFSLKSGDDWQTIPFNIEFLKKGSMETVYATTRVVAPVAP